MSYKNKITTAFLLLLLLLAIYSFPLIAFQTPNPEKSEITSTVIQVYDGNTIKLTNGMEVRYLGLNTPETHHPEKPVEYFGVKDSGFNKQLVEGKKVKLNTTSRKKTSTTGSWLTSTSNRTENV